MAKAKQAVKKPVKKKKKPKNYYFDQVVENAIIRYNNTVLVQVLEVHLYQLVFLFQ